MSSSPHSHLQFPLRFLFPIFLLFHFPLFPSLCIPPTPPIPFPSHLFLSPPPHILFMPVLLSPLFLPLLSFLSNHFSSFFPSPHPPPPFLFISLVLLLDPYFPPSSQRVWPFHDYDSFFEFPDCASTRTDTIRQEGVPVTRHDSRHRSWRCRWSTHGTPKKHLARS